MAELVLKVGTRRPDPDWQDGDIISAWNTGRIRMMHASHLCDVRTEFTGQGLRDFDSFKRRCFFDNVYRYRFERVSEREVKRIDLDDDSEVTFSDTPQEVDGRIQYIDVPRFVARRLSHYAHCVFGQQGREVWYGISRPLTSDLARDVWDAIEGATAYRRVRYRSRPVFTEEMRSFLVIQTHEFSDTKRLEYESAETDSTGQYITKQRQHRIDWRARLELSEREKRDVVDRRKVVDIRGRQFAIASRVERKP